MKKGLSILLIAAALFGFYGGATSLNDVLASKDYWEKEGERSTADMNKLEDGLNQLGDNKQAYLDGLDTLAEGEQALEEGKKTLAQGEADYAAAPGKLRAGEAKLAAGKAAYKSGKAQYDAGKKQYNEAAAKLAEIKKKLSDMGNYYSKWSGGIQTLSDNVEDYADLNENGQLSPTKIAEYRETKVQAVLDAAGAVAHTTFSEATLREAAQTNPALQPFVDKIDELDEKVITNANNLVLLRAGMTTEIQKFVKGLDKETMKELDPKGELAPVIAKLSDLPDTQDIAALGIPSFKTVVGGLLAKAAPVVKEKEGELAAAKKQLDDAEKQLAAGKKEIKAGEAKLAQGYADYAAAPAKLAAGRQALADGLKQIEDGKKKLAEYEDGEQQVRDGLATLMSTEPDGGLESILDRRNGDDNFDDAQGHLDVDEGLDAVEVGRGYQADSGELITKEITGRAVGTAAGLGAAVLAVLAAILSFAKKYKGAAVSAILAAAAGCAGALVGNNAGDEFSNIAGSTVGATPWIAAGVLAAVALVFAIAHFTAKPEA